MLYRRIAFWIILCGPCLIVNCLTDPSGLSICSHGWTKLDTTLSGSPSSGQSFVCLKSYTEQEVTWPEARQICNGHRADLITFKHLYYGVNDAEIKSIQWKIGNYLEKNGITNSWTSMFADHGLLTWDGEVPSSVLSRNQSMWMWAAGEPSQLRAGCVMVTVSQTKTPTTYAAVTGSSSQFALELAIKPCQNKLRFVCINKGFKIENKAVPRCKPGWIGNVDQDTCYWSDGSLKTYEHARKVCKRKGSTLVTPYNNFLHNFTMNAASTIATYLHKQLLSSDQSLQCYSCQNVNSEDDCLRKGTLITCSPGYLCQSGASVDANRQLIINKGCLPPTDCAENEAKNVDTCKIPSSGSTQLDGVQCYQCCSQNECNQKVEEGDIATLLKSFQKQQGATVKPYGGDIFCWHCENTISEQSCLESGQLEKCSAGSTCETQVNRDVHGQLTIRKGCVPQQMCQDHQATNWKTCPIQTNQLFLSTQGTGNIICYYCCHSSACNQNLASSNLPIGILLRETPFWIGLRRRKDHLEWDDNTKWDEDQGRFRPGNILSATTCVAIIPGKPHRHEWQSAPCADQKRFICQKQANNIGTVKMTKQPRDFHIPRSAIKGWFFANAQSSNSSAISRMTCQAENYQAHMPVIWVKDGSYINNGPPPLGLDLDLTIDIIHSLGGMQGGTVPHMQGYYWCELWGQNPIHRVSSKKALLTFQDVINFRGIVTLRKVKFDVNKHVMTSQNYNSEMLSYMMTIQDLGILDLKSGLYYPEVQVTAFRSLSGDGSLVLEFLISFSLPLSKEHEDLAAVSSTEGSIMGVAEKFLFNELQNTIVERIKDKTGQWYSRHSNLELAPSDVVLRSTLGCQMRVTTRENRKLKWEWTSVGQLGRTEQVCLADGQPLGESSCLGNFSAGAYWGHIHWHSTCKDPPNSKVTATLRKLSEDPVSRDNVEKVAEDLNKLTEETDQLTYSDLVYTSQVIKHVAEVAGSKKKVGESMVEIVSRILDLPREKIEQAQMINNASNRITDAVGMFSKLVDLETTSVITIVRPNVALQIWDVNDSQTVKLGFGTTAVNHTLEEEDVINYEKRNVNQRDVDTGVFVPKEALDKAFQFRALMKKVGDNLPLPENGIHTSGNSVRLIYTHYQKADLFLTPSQLRNETKQKVANSKVIAVAFGGILISNLTQRVQTVFLPRKHSNRSHACVYWDFAAGNGTGNWSTKGCWSGEKDGDRETCYCNHMTNFAILTEFDSSPLDAVHLKIMSIITLIGVSMSIVGLGFTVLTFFVFSRLRQGRSQKVLFNLAVALLFAYIVFLIGIEWTRDYVVCVVVAALLQYFLLVAFCWMLIEAILQYLLFVKVLDNYVQKFMLKTAFPAWVVPGVIVGTVAAVDYDLFKGSPNYCWLDRQAAYFAFLLPVGLVVIINTILFSLVVKGITCSKPTGMRSTQAGKRLAMLQVQAGIACFVVLGVTWVFGFLAISDARLPFQYLFCIFNSLQGFMIFLFHNIREKAVRDSWRALCCNAERPGDPKRKFSSTDTTGYVSRLHSGSDLKPLAHYNDGFQFKDPVETQESCGGISVVEIYLPTPFT